MENVDRKKIAYDLFLEGFNCAQAVTAAFADLLPLSKDELLNLAAPFGAGFARGRDICGTISAMGLVVGLYNSTKDIDPHDKGAIYEQVGKLTEMFKNINGSTICGELLKNVKDLTKGYEPQVRDERYYNARPCLKFVLDSVDIIEESIFSQEK